MASTWLPQEEQRGEMLVDSLFIFSFFLQALLLVLEGGGSRDSRYKK